MDEHTSNQEDDDMNEEPSPTLSDNDGNKIQDEQKSPNSETETEMVSSIKERKDSDSAEEKENRQAIFFPTNDNTCASNNSCSGEKNDEGNLLGSIVTMHNMSNYDDDYSPTLAICDIFNKSKDSPIKSVTPKLTKDEENKDEFLIIDLDTCQMKKKSESDSETRKEEIKSPSKELIFVNLSRDETQSDFLNKPSNRDEEDANSENNFLVNSKECDTKCHDQIIRRKTEKTNKERGTSPELEMKENMTYDVNNRKSTPQMKILQSDAEIKRENCLQHKGIVFHDESMCDESILSKEIYSTDVSFHSSDLNVSFHSNENQGTEPDFYLPELYSKTYHEEDKTDPPQSAFTKFSTHNSSLDTDNNNQFFDYTINDNLPFDTPLSSHQHNNAESQDFYDHQQAQRANQYNLESKIISNFVAMETKGDTSSIYGSQENIQPYCYKSRVSATIGSNKCSPYSSVQDRASSSPFFHPPYMSNYRPQYPFNNMQHNTEINPRCLSSSASNYSDWNSWSGSAFYEVNLNTFSSVHNMESQCHQGKDEWGNDAVMPELYHDPEMNIKSNQAEIDSEATEDADETDDVPIFFEDSADFSACDNLSTISVMSSSCYSDNSSVMTAMSPSDFTPPPSVSNTPLPPNHNIVTDNQRCTYPFINDNSRSEPLHLYSPTMLSVTPYKLSQEKIEQNLLNYDRGQKIKRYYPSMADMHNSRSGFTIPSTSKFDTNEMFEFPDYRTSSKNQIQSDKISTSTSKSAYNKKTENTPNYNNQQLETYANFMKQEDTDFRNESRRLRHNEPLRQTAIRIMSQWYEDHLDNPYPTKEDKMKMARDGGITVTQVKSWFANKRNRTNNTKPKVQKRAMKEKLKKLFQDLKHSRSDSLDNSHIIQQLSGIIQT